jgi:hypothetical protein
MAYEWKSTRLFRHVHIKRSRMLRSGGIVLDETFRESFEFFVWWTTSTSHLLASLNPPPPGFFFFFLSVVVILFFNGIHGFLLRKSWGISIILCIDLKFGFYFIISWFLDKDVVVCFSSLDFTFIKLILNKLRG